MPRARTILLSDCDMYYVQVARMVDPEGAGRAKLLIVGGSRESRGVVCSASYEVRAFGVRSGMPVAQAARLCPEAMCVPVPREECALKSREIVAVLERFAPAVESASPDEAYLDLTSAMGTLYRDVPLDALARRIRRGVRDATGVQVSIGGGTSKLIAKLAVELAKPKPESGATGVHIVEPGLEGELLRRFALADLPGVGPKLQERLRSLGLTHVTDVLPYERRQVEALLGERLGGWIHDCVRGVDESEVTPDSDARSIGREETFARDILADGALRRELLRLVDRVTADLRAAGCAARTVTVKLRDADFTTRQAGRTFDRPVTTERAIAPVACGLLDALRERRRAPARLIGVSLSKLSHDHDAAQLSLWAGEGHGGDSARDRALAGAVDRVRERFGHEAIALGEPGVRE